MECFLSEMWEDLGVQVGEKGTYSNPLTALGKGPAIAPLRNWKDWTREWNKVLQQNLDGAYRETQAVLLPEKRNEQRQHTPQLPRLLCARESMATSQLPPSLPKPQTPFPACNLPSRCSGEGSSFIPFPLLQAAKHVNKPEKSWTCLQQGVGLGEILCCVNRPQVFCARTSFLILLGKSLTFLYIYMDTWFPQLSTLLLSPLQRAHP